VQRNRGVACRQQREERPRSLKGPAAFTTALVVGVQERTLSRDLEDAAAHRLDRAAHAAEQLVHGHLAALDERYRAISGTPQFRANLGVEHPPTLAFYAQQLGEQQGATAVAFFDRQGRVIASGGDAALAERAMDARGGALIVATGVAQAAIAVPIRNGDEEVGRLVAVEPIRAAALAHWSDLCGADVSFEAVSDLPPHAMARTVRRFDGQELRVTASLDAERAALAHARANLLLAGGAAFGLSLLASLFSSRAAGCARSCRSNMPHSSSAAVTSKRASTARAMTRLAKSRAPSTGWRSACSRIDARWTSSSVRSRRRCRSAPSRSKPPRRKPSRSRNKRTTRTTRSRSSSPT
jgi:hypothetical protein